MNSTNVQNKLKFTTDAEQTLNECFWTWEGWHESEWETKKNEKMIW